MKNQNSNNNKVNAQQVLINNLKKKLVTKRDEYNEMIYRTAILQIANEKFPVTKNSYLDISYLPVV